MPRIDVIANPEATKEAVVTVTNLFDEKFRVRVVFYPNKIKKRIKEDSRNGNQQPESTDLLSSLAAGSVSEVEDDDYEEFDPVKRMRRQNEEQLFAAAASFCEQYESWDLTGPLKDDDGKMIVGEEEIIPMIPEVVRFVPAWLRAEVNTGVNEILFPSLRGSRPSRKRS